MTITNADSPLMVDAPTLLSEVGWWTRMWFRDDAASFASGTDDVYNFIFWTCVAFFVPLMGLLVWFGYKYRRRPGVPAEPSPAHNTPLEIAWSVIPALLMVVMFVWGAYAYLKKVVAPSDAEVIWVNAKKWAWTFEYPGGVTSLETETVADQSGSLFALPVDTNVKFMLTSEDVIHSFYVPEFRVKRDCFPNRYTSVWARPTRVTHTFNAETKKSEPIVEGDGLYLFCAEYCGDQHSQMGNRIAVMSQTDYRAWLEAQQDTSSIPLVELGEQLSVAQGCMSCHRADERDGSGPSWKNIWDTDRPGWRSTSEDEPDGKVGFSYIRESILEPGAYVKQGWPNNMPSYQGKLNEREVRAIATYIMSLSDDFAEQAEQRSQEELEGADTESDTEGGAESETEGDADVAEGDRM